MGQTHLARLRQSPAAHENHRRDAVMRRSERLARHEAPEGQQPRHAPDPAHLDRLSHDARWFEPWMIRLILFNSVLIGLETSQEFVES